MLPEIFLQHVVTVEPYTGIDGHGRPTFGAPFTVECWCEDARRTVRDKAGAETVSESTFYADPGPTIPALSRVTLASGRPSTVIIVKNHDAGDLDELPEHIEVNCE
ncbi:hypothetical protein AB0B28_08150 [Glycomyces sp. NPDC046736]|uniref:hypothetical protein n=1 Tax=Glycomyces sp. NPDC046736 TaxID=3155615 RepID=UPI00340E4D1A